MSSWGSPSGRNLFGDLREGIGCGVAPPRPAAGTTAMVAGSHLATALQLPARFVAAAPNATARR
ncbi:hypothetical protein GCM10009731_08000 [Streptomyces globosus]